MSAAATLDAAMRAALAAIPGVNGVRRTADRHAGAPYIVLGMPIASDWGTKDCIGRELRVIATVRDVRDDPARAQAIADAIEAAVASLPRRIGGWDIASVALIRTQIVAEANGGWAGLVDHRVRMLAIG